MMFLSAFFGAYNVTGHMFLLQVWALDLTELDGGDAAPPSPLSPGTFMKELPPGFVQCPGCPKVS